MKRFAIVSIVGISMLLTGCNAFLDADELGPRECTVDCIDGGNNSTTDSGILPGDGGSGVDSGDVGDGGTSENDAGGATCIDPGQCDVCTEDNRAVTTCRYDVVDSEMCPVEVMTEVCGQGTACQAGECTPCQFCEPENDSCQDDTLIFCLVDPISECSKSIEFDCIQEDGATCQQAGCQLPQNCNVGARYCQNPTLPLECQNVNGEPTWYLLETCPAGTLCMNGQCV